MTLEFSNVTAVAKANIYFDGKVVSHTLRVTVTVTHGYALLSTVNVGYYT